MADGKGFIVKRGFKLAVIAGHLKEVWGDEKDAIPSQSGQREPVMPLPLANTLAWPGGVLRNIDENSIRENDGFQMTFNSLPVRIVCGSPGVKFNTT
ncbi:MAG: hypothetical protein QM296_09365 [Bacillota bacterium]|nr:hypothetical protein [Bacillota bacterium]